jgi:hypothetical protein
MGHQTTFSASSPNEQKILETTEIYFKENRTCI